MCTGLILGVVIAHEMGHLLLGPDCHSRYGIMRPNWHIEDLQDAFFGRQGFMPEQVRELHVNLLARTQAAESTLVADSSLR